jgi:hypothetical protein
MAQPDESPRNHESVLQPSVARPVGRVRARALRRSPPVVPPTQATLAFAEPPVATDAWWLARSREATFALRQIPVSDACARELTALWGGRGRLVVEFNGASFLGATLATTDGHHELELGDALAQAMAEALDEDDGLTVDVVTGQRQPTLAIHPYLMAVR